MLCTILASNRLVYSWPAFFLIEFIAEHIATSYAQFKVACQIIGNQLSVERFMTEQLTPGQITGTECDPSHRSDVVLDIMKAVLIFFYSGGFNILK